MSAQFDTLDFEGLRAQSPAPSTCTTFTYWIGVLVDPDSKIATDADEACAAMSHQYDVEEQDNLCGYPEYIPSVFRPIAPVTLAYKWSPLPLSLKIMGAPIRANAAHYGKIVLVFKPGNPQTLPKFRNLDIDHFLYLLDTANLRASPNKYVLLCGSPGWAYERPDPIYRSTRKLMKEFGFVVQSRKPRRSLWNFLRFNSTDSQPNSSDA